MRFLSTLIASTLGTLIAVGLLMFLLFLFVLAITVSADTSPDVRRGSVLRMHLSGGFPEVASDDPLLRLATGVSPQDLTRFRTNLRKAASDDRIAALWLELGGVSAPWATLEEMREAILLFKASGKPIYASAPSFYMDESDYYLAAAADSIFLAPQSLFEFNGFHITAEFYKTLLDRLSVAPQVVRAGDYKSAGESYTRTDLSPENEEQLAAILADWNHVFTSSVAADRKMDAARVQELMAQGNILTATDALRSGLIDGIHYEDEVRDALRSRLGYDVDDDLEEVEGRAYTRVPLAQAGIRPGKDGDIAIVHASGVMVGGASGVDPNPLFGGVVVGSETFGKAMDEARENERVKAIVIRIDSPGGLTPAADEMWRAARRAAGEKPVIISMGSYAASGGYWLATAGETIVADPLTITGSIGVFSVVLDAGGLFEDKIGITFDGVATTEHADMFSGLRSLSAAERALLERSTMETYQAFLERVADARRMSVEDVEAVARGRVWTGVRAREIGLVDTLGSLRTAIQIAARRVGLEEGSYRLQVLPRPASTLERLFERMGSYAASFTAARMGFDGHESARRHLARLEQLSASHGQVMARMPLEIRME